MKNEANIITFIIMLLLGLLLLPMLPLIIPIIIIFDVSKSTKRKKKQKFTKSEIDNYGLSDKEKELVKSGNYEPWDFDDDEIINEDDYYNEDE